MTEQVTPSESDISVPAPVTSDKADDHRVPLARLNEEVAKRRVLEEQVAHMADTMLAAIPEHLKALIPSEYSPAAKVAWFLQARDTGIFGQAVNVPETDNRKPKITPVEPDFNSLSPTQKLAAAYSNRK